jgi:hypothetical protein
MAGDGVPGDGVPGDGVEVRRNDQAERYEILLDGTVVGHLATKERPNAVILVHTETDTALQGRGLAARLVTAALDDLRAKGKRVVVRCPYVREFIDEHPEYANLEFDG